MGKKFSQFPPAASISPGDSLVGLKDGENTRFSFATVFSYIQSLFVPTSRKVNNKTLSSDITLDASDVGAVDTAEVGVADGVAGLDSNGKVPSSQLPPISSDAADITYDPTTSGASATNVQNALDEAFDDLSGKQDEITTSGILKGDGQGGVSAATPGTDYGTYSKPSGGIPLNDLASGIAPYVNYSNRIHSLSGYNASWTATANCFCVAQIGSSGNTVAAVYVDGIQVLGTAQVSTAYYTYPYIGTFYVKQGQTVSTRDVSGQNYSLFFYALY